MKNNFSLQYGLLLIVGDFAALVAAFVGAYILRVSVSHKPISETVHASTYIEIFLLLLPFWILVFALLGLYNNSIYEKRFAEAGRLLIGSFLGLLFVVGFAYFYAKPVFPAHLVPIYGFAFSFLFLLIFRNFARFIRSWLFRYGYGVTNVLVIGDTEIAKELAESLKNWQESGYRIVGIVGEQAGKLKYFGGLKTFDNFGTAVAKIKASHIHSIVQTQLYPSTERNNEILEFAQTHHIAYRFIPGNGELFVGNIAVELFRSSIPVIAVHQTALFGWGRIVKRLFDITICSVAIILTMPVIIVVGIINFFASGSVFFRQTRLTRFNHKFRVFKFRTQYKKFDGTPEEAFAMIGKPELAKKYRENGDYLEDDPRITPFGQFLRSTSLDELPQLFNVIKGDLSLVGPRALIPQELDKHEKRHAILSVKSGITGLAQVSGRRGINYEERRKLDVYYVQNWSFWLDVTIILKTVRVVLRGEGAK